MGFVRPAGAGHRMEKTRLQAVQDVEAMLPAASPVAKHPVRISTVRTSNLM